MHQCDNMGIGLPPAYSTSMKRKILKATCSLNMFELIHAMKCNHHKFQKKIIKGLIKLRALNVFIRFLILLSMNLTCNLIQSLILLSKVS